jgi:hypothetical protein
MRRSLQRQGLPAPAGSQIIHFRRLPSGLVPLTPDAPGTILVAKATTVGSVAMEFEAVS